MPSPRTHVSIIKSCHVYCSSSTDCISSQGGPWDDGTQGANGCHQCSKMPSSKKEGHHQNPVLSQIALAQFSEDLSSWAPLQSQLIKHHLQCFMPVPRAQVSGACSARFLALTSEVSRAQMWDCPQTAQCPGPASLHRYIFP